MQYILSAQRLSQISVVDCRVISNLLPILQSEIGAENGVNVPCWQEKLCRRSKSRLSRPSLSKKSLSIPLMIPVLVRNFGKSLILDFELLITYFTGVRH